MPDIAGLGADPDDRAFLGHPRALGYLAFAEAWERFSYYGMQALLGLYMAKQLLLPGHVDKVVGFPAFRDFLSHYYGHEMTTVAAATATVGLYSSLVYMTPILGGLLADRVLGKTATVTVGALLMTAGHFLMAFEQSFLLALLCLVVGAGCFKGNIASQVGGLYADGDLRRADAFQIFYLGVNAGVIVAPLVIGTLGETIGWHWGFGVAGVGMIIGLCIYLAGRRYLPNDAAPRRAPKAERPKLGPRELRALVLLLALIPVLAAGAVGNLEIYNGYLLWADAHLDLQVFGVKAPTTWLQTLDALTSAGFLVGMLVFWRLWAKRFPEPDELGKITFGVLVSAVAVLFLVAGSAQEAATGQKVSFWWAVGFHLVNSIGYANLLPVALALYARSAPKALGSTMLGVFYLHLFGASYLTGKVGDLLETWPPVQFWLLHAVLVGGAGAVFVLVTLFLRGWLRPSSEARAG